jgi:hypothetical protein
MKNSVKRLVICIPLFVSLASVQMARASKVKSIANPAIDCDRHLQNPKDQLEYDQIGEIRSHSLGDTFQLIAPGFADGEKNVVVSERTLRFNYVLPIHESMVSYLTILDPVSMKRKITLMDVQILAQAGIHQLGDQSKIVPMIANQIRPSSDGPYIGFYSKATSGNAYAFVYNYNTGELLSYPLGTIRHLSFIKIEHGRFLVISESNIDNPQTHWIMDIKSKRSLSLSTPKNSEVRISVKGDKILASAMENNVARNWLVKLEPKIWKTASQIRPAVVAPPVSEIGAVTTFPGLVRASAGNLNRFIVDVTDGRLQQREGSKNSYILPDLQVVSGSDDFIQQRPLRGWSPILQKLKDGVNRGLEVQWDGVSGSITEDGRYATIRITPKIRSEPLRGLVLIDNHDLVGLWNLDTDQEPFLMTSTGLDTPEDSEFSFRSQLSGKPFDGSTVFETQLGRDGKLTIVRAVAHVSPPDGTWSATVKWLEVEERGSNGFFTTLYEGKLPFDGKNLNLKSVPTVGISSISIGALGQSVLVATDDHNQGLILVKRGSLKAASRPSIFSLDQIAPGTQKYRGYIGDPFGDRPWEIRKTYLSDEDRAAIQGLFVDSFKVGQETFYRAFEIFVNARLRDLSPAQKARVERRMKKFVFDRRANAGPITANIERVSLPPRTFDSAATYGIAAHELAHIVRLVSQTMHLSLKEFDRYKFDLSDDDIASDLEFESIVAEWEYWHLIPLEFRLQAVEAIYGEVPVGPKRQILVEGLKSAGLEAEAYLDHMATLGRRISTPRLSD